MVDHQEEKEKANNAKYEEAKSVVFPFHLLLKYHLDEETRKRRENRGKVVRINGYEDKRDKYFDNVILKRKK